MAKTNHVEMRPGERWADVAEAFLAWCLQEKNVTRGGLHEGDAVAFADGERFAAISIPDHSPELIEHLHAWAEREGRELRRM